MHLQWLTRLAGRIATPPEQRAACAVRPQPCATSTPHAAATLGLRTPQAILEANGDLLRRLRLHAACEEARFALRFVAPLHRLARHVNVLPATEAGLFCGCMGLFRACLESAFFSFQAADGRIFTGSEGVERRHALEWRWRYVCFLGGMLYPAGRPLQRIVLLQAEGEDWKHQAGGVTAWAEGAGLDRLMLAWRSTEEEGESIGPSAVALALMAHVVGRENLAVLEEGATELVAALCELAVGRCGLAPLAHATIAGSWQRIRARQSEDQGLPAAVASARAMSSREQGPPLPQPAASAAPASAPAAPGRDQETPPARYADLLPPDLRQEISAKPHAEGLGRIVHAWRHRAQGSTVMRRIDSGAAIEFGFLTTAVVNVPIWLDAMVRCGLVHAPAQSPGLRIQKVEMADGQAPVQALVLSNFACRRLGL